MELVAAFGGGAFILTSLVLGLRLVWIARRTRGLPEFVLGFGLFLMGGLGYPLMAVAQQATGMDMHVRVGMLVTQMLCTTIGMTGVTLFTRRVFRPGETWAAWTTPGCLLAYLAMMIGQGAGPGFAAALQGADAIWFRSSYIGIAVMVWTGAESLRYHLMLRRRQALGLAEPAVVDRFRLWSISMFAASSISLLGIVLRELFGVSVNGTTAGNLLVGPLGLVIAIALWLAFLPPAFYLRRVERVAAARSATA
jgi:hypothetical protein